MPFRKPTSLNVMFLIDILGQMGGAERNLDIVARELRTRGYNVIIVALQGGELSKTMSREGFKVVDLNLNKIYDFKGLCSFIQLVRFTKQEKVSIIVSYHESSDFMGLLISILSRIPIISSRRDMGFKLKPRHVFAYRILNRFFNHIATVSSAVKENIMTTQGADPSRITVIPNGVDLSIEDRVASEKVCNIEDELEIDNGLIKICCLANIRPIKGHPDIIAMAGEVVKQFPSVRFFLIGKKDVDENYYDDLCRQIELQGLRKFIKFTGELSPNKVFAELKKMDISVLSSLSEGMSNTLLESMASALPVVATAVGGNTELVVDGKTGYLVPPGDPQSLSQALLKLLLKPELRREMGLRGKSRVELLFTVERMVNRFEDLLQYLYQKKKIGVWLKIRAIIKNMIHYVITSGKVLMSSMLYYSGLIAIFRTAKRVLRLGKVKILCFHNISEEKGLPLSINISPGSFSNILNFLVDHYRVVSLEEAAFLLETGQALTDDVFALSFDDCYKGWIEYVIPECKRLQTPCTFFIATDPMDSGEPLFYDILVFLVESTWRKVADLSHWGLGVFFLDTNHNIIRFIEKVHKYWLEKSKEEQKQFLKHLSEYFEVTLSREKFRSISLNWDEVREMDRAGANLGAHSVSHVCLSHVPIDESFWQISHGKNRLEEEVGHSIDFFAYPFGASDHYNPETTRLVEDAGFRYAFTLGTPNGNEFKTFEIGRRGVTHGMFNGLKSDYFEPLFATEICGLADYLFGRKLMKRKVSLYGKSGD